MGWEVVVAIASGRVDLGSWAQVFMASLMDSVENGL